MFLVFDRSASGQILVLDRSASGQIQVFDRSASAVFLVFDRSASAVFLVLDRSASGQILVFDRSASAVFSRCWQFGPLCFWSDQEENLRNAVILNSDSIYILGVDYNMGSPLAFNISNISLQ